MLIPRRAGIASVALALTCVRAAEVPAQRRSLACAAADDPETTARLTRDVAFLADDAREGREPGTRGWDESVDHVVRALTALGAEPAGTDGYLQPFEVDYGMEALGDGGARPRRVRTVNVLARVRGDGDGGAAGAVLVGAHLDHIGHGVGTSRTRSTAVHNGADDNASGSAAVLELARRLRARPAARDVVFAWFGAEELGLRGSTHLAAHPVPATTQLAAMVNFDMVGRLRDCRVVVEGRETARGFADVMRRANEPYRFDTRPWDPRRGSWGSSDHESFSTRGTPVLFFFTGLHDDYHTERDDLRTLNLAGTSAVVGLAERAIRDVAALPASSLVR